MKENETVEAINKITEH